MKNIKGYTLVEIAIVIMILSLLSLICKGFYDRAVEKSRWAEAYTVVGNIIDAQKGFHVLNDSFARDFEKLDLNIDGTRENNGSGESHETLAIKTRDFRYSISATNDNLTEITVQRIQNGNNVGVSFYLTYVDQDASGDLQENFFYVTKKDDIFSNGSISEGAVKEMEKLADFFVTR